MKIAVIITGDVRDCHLNKNFNNLFPGIDIFIGSYIKHKPYFETFKCNKINMVLIDPISDIRFPSGINKDKMQQNMLQWLHMDNILKKYKNDLLKYDVIFKVRFDTKLFVKENPINYTLPLYNVALKTLENKLYCNSDRVFYSKSKTFIKLFEDFYDEVINKTHKFKDLDLDINIIDIAKKYKKTWRSENAFDINRQNKEILKSELGFGCKIIRGNYNKTTADGNLKLYYNNKLMGKFQ
jgi:hypothetical protein